MSLKDIRIGLRAFLIADAAIAAAVAEVGGTKWRVYPVRLPQATTGASIVYNRISGQGDHHMQGPSGLARVRMQIDCWAPSHDTSTSLADIVKEAIDGYQGMMGSVFVQGVFFDGERDLDFDDATKFYGVSRDYMITYAER